MEGKELLREDVVRIPAADFSQECVAVDRGSLRTGASLQMMSYSRGGCEAALAEGTGDVGASMDLAVEMLRDRQSHITLTISETLTALKLFSFSKPL